MDGQPRAYMQHVAAAAEYSSSREIDVMGDGAHVRQSNSTENSAYLSHAHGVACCCGARQGCWLYRALCTAAVVAHCCIWVVPNEAEQQLPGI